MNEYIYIVSGLPRSGTSMMMLILKEGGIEPIYDPSRGPNIANPNGFFEATNLDDLQIGAYKPWMDNAGGKALKIVSGRLAHLPHEYSYKVIVMRRVMEEIIQSRRKIFAAVGNPDANECDGWFRYIYQGKLDEGFSVLRNSSNMEYIEVNYNDLMANPEPSIDAVIAFLGLPLDKARMMAVPDNSLYRNRVTA